MTNQTRLTRGELARIADESLKAIDAGSYVLPNALGEADSITPSKTFDLKDSVNKLKEQTSFYAHDSSDLSSWRDDKIPPGVNTRTRIWAVEKTSLEAALLLLGMLDKATPESDIPNRSHAIGVLNFASAKNPGGGFLSGSSAQEESITRSSTLYHSLTSTTGQKFYDYNHRIMTPKNDAYYSHAMIYSPSVLVFRNDQGEWIEPYDIDVLTSPAVNAGVVRSKLQQSITKMETGEDGEDTVGETEGKIKVVMKERMARILRLFEIQGVKNIVLGSFGTGVFRNKVDMVVDLWAQLLVGDNVRFSSSFDRVVFGVVGNDTYKKFEDKFGTDIDSDRW